MIGVLFAPVILLTTDAFAVQACRRGPLRTALRLVQIGGGTPPWYESGADGVQTYLVVPALLCILTGSTCRNGPPAGDVAPTAALGTGSSVHCGSRPTGRTGKSRSCQPERTAVAEAACIAAALRAHERNMAPRRDNTSVLHTDTTDLTGKRPGWPRSARPSAGRR